MTAVATRRDTAVLGWPDTGAQGGLDDLWERVNQLGWFDMCGPRVVIQIGQAGRSPLVVDTARSLIGFLTARLPQCSIEIVDRAATDHEWRQPVRNLATEERLWVSGIAATEGLQVPRFWFESFNLITIAGPCPHPALGIAGVLAAQADCLVPVHTRYSNEILAYEAHRLAASDLGIACGHADSGNPASAQWWMASPSDVALDRAVAVAAGIAPARLPCLREVARHEVMATAFDCVGSVPRLRGYAASSWRMQMHAIRSQVAATQHHVTHDMKMARSNVRKIPGFVRRRLAATRRPVT